jgi:hypothetical protein
MLGFWLEEVTNAGRKTAANFTLGLLLLLITKMPSVT